MQSAHKCALLVATVAVLSSTPSLLATVPIYGGPTYSSVTGGFNGVAIGNNWTTLTALGVASEEKYMNDNTQLGFHVFRLTPSGPQELGTLGSDGTRDNATAYTMNSSGVIVGSSTKYSGTTNLGDRPVFWNVGSTTPIELPILGTDNSGSSSGSAVAINDSGVIVGSAFKYVNGVNLGMRVMRWDLQGNASELGVLSTDNTGYNFAYAYGLNGAGAVVGRMEKYVGGIDRGTQAIRWDASGTAAHELAPLTTSPSGNISSAAVAINSTGTIVGISEYYDSFGSDLGSRAVRWNAAGTVATELYLGQPPSPLFGGTSTVSAINDSGTIVGTVQWNNTSYIDTHAVRWDANGNGTLLGLLGMDPNSTTSHVYGLNASGAAVGSIYDYSTTRAVYWGADGSAIDLNTLIDPSSGWSLTEAMSISDTNWVVGYGSYDPDGAGGQAPYARAFLMQVPEPASLALVGVGIAIVCSRRRRRS